MKKLIVGLLGISFCFVNAQEVSTIATIPNNYGDGMIVNIEGDILVSGGYDKSDIIKITPDGVVSTFIEGLPGPVGMGFDSLGNLYVANYSGNSISKITTEGIVSVFDSGLDGPAGLIVNNDEIFVTLYGSNFSGTGSTVLKYNLNGTSEVYAQNSGILDPIGITMDEENNIFVSNFIGGNVFQIDDNQEIITFANVTGSSINQIVYSNNFIYVPSPNLRKIYRVDTSSGIVEHIAGNGGNSILDGDLLEAEFNRPNSCAINLTGDILYILEHNAGLIRAIDLSEILVVNEQEIEISDFLITPNPSIDLVTLEFSSSENYSVRIFDVLGKEILQLSGDSFQEKITKTLDVSSWSKGTYFVEVRSGSYSETKKLIK